MKTIDEMIAVMQAAKGGALIEICNFTSTGKWEPCCGMVPLWNWNNYDYRVAITKPYIDWNHVSKEFVAMATDHDGKTYLHMERGLIYRDQKWVCGGYLWVSTEAFSSFRAGTCAPEDSLVLRPVVVEDAAEENHPDDNGWIQWHGGEMPTIDRVDIRYRNGELRYSVIPNCYNWDNAGRQGDIVAYRVSK